MNGIIDKALQQIVSRDLEMEHLTSVHGGSINKAYLADTNRGKFLVKLHKGDDAGENHEAEIHGLKLLQTHLPLGSTPDIIGHFNEKRVSILVLKWIERSPFEKKFWEDLASKLARPSVGLALLCTKQRYPVPPNNHLLFSYVSPALQPQRTTRREHW